MLIRAKNFGCYFRIGRDWRDCLSMSGGIGFDGYEAEGSYPLYRYGFAFRVDLLPVLVWYREYRPQDPRVMPPTNDRIVGFQGWPFFAQVYGPNSHYDAGSL